MAVDAERERSFRHSENSVPYRGAPWNRLGKVSDPRLGTEIFGGSSLGRGGIVIDQNEIELIEAVNIREPQRLVGEINALEIIESGGADS